MWGNHGGDDDHIGFGGDARVHVVEGVVGRYSQRTGQHRCRTSADGVHKERR